MKELGFTGTQKGMRPRQLKAVRQLLHHVNKLHLGDCVGADAEVYEEAKELGIYTIGHPSALRNKRAYLDYDLELPTREPLIRNHDIVDAGVDGLIAAPSGWAEVLRSGTWATIRYARKVGRRIWIVRPDGTIVNEDFGPPADVPKDLIL